MRTERIVNTMGRVPSHPIGPTTTYICHPVHRNGRPGKSQWTINEQEEVDCFRQTFQAQWIIDHKGWGLHIVNGFPYKLGVAQDRVTDVFVAKFVGNQQIAEWHGFPADHRKNSSDKVDEAVAWDWLERGFLTGAKVRKLIAGQPCRL